MSLMGGRDENFVVISVARKALVDVPEKTRGCSSCSVSSSLLLKLDGLCKDSMIGKILTFLDDEHIFYFRQEVQDLELQFFCWLQWVEEYVHQVY